jgi:hypothetical protein
MKRGQEATMSRCDGNLQTYAMPVAHDVIRNSGKGQVDRH